MSARTMLDKIWTNHVVSEGAGKPSVLYIDTHLIHEVTSPQAFSVLRERGLKVHRPERTFATMDHAIPTRALALDLWPSDALLQVQTLRKNCEDFGITLFDLGGHDQGIVHVIGPEQGITQPGSTIVCGDSHTSTHGAFGALAFGIGTSEVSHVMATQCLMQNKPKSFSVKVNGQLGPGVTAKDVVLAIIAKIGTGGGTGHVLEYRGEVIENLDMAGRMTVCNMSIEAGARAGMIAPDATTFEYLKGKPYSPQGEAWERAVAKWKTLATDEGAVFDKSIELDGSEIPPMVSYGTNPGQAIGVGERVPDPQKMASNDKLATSQALDYMNLKPGAPIKGQPIDVVFIGSCTNGRLEDLRAAAKVARGRRVMESVRALVVPGSKRVRAAAESEGLDKIFKDSGFEWREAGCSMCLAMNDDKAASGEYVASTSNRNFRGRQGPGSRTMLMSPAMAAAAAVHGKVVDVREI